MKLTKLLESRFAGCMIGSAIGDALGVSIAISQPEALESDRIRFHGRWTDDTHMMIGLAESLIKNKGFDGKHMAWTFVQNWEKEPWRGYGPGPPNVFRMMKSGVPWNKAANQLYGGGGSYGNGAAMRVAPVGLLYYDNPARIREVACNTAEITHTHQLGKEGAAIQAYAVALAMQTENLEPKKFLQRIIAFSEDKIFTEKLKKAAGLLSTENKGTISQSLGNTVEAFNSVPTAIYCFARNPSNHTEAVLYAASLGGDIDTIGAMTGAIAGAHLGERGLSTSWKKKLERTRYIKELAHKLYELKTTHAQSL